ncbi:ammonium transporter AmtB-like domain-containing protein [Mycena amicta]|nr:ammonium transporter AmtB-like domain-containing protein [Mycena amicta]
MGHARSRTSHTIRPMLFSGRFSGGLAGSGSTAAAHFQPMCNACIVTNLAASVGGLTWMLWDYRIEKKWSAVAMGFCSGAIAGLVAITPGSGFVGSPASVLFGVVAATACNFATQIKFFRTSSRDTTTRWMCSRVMQSVA